MMAEITNLNRYRKRKAREEKSQKAAANRTKFGRTGKQKNLDRHNSEKMVDFIDAHKREPSSGQSTITPDKK